MDVKKGIHGDIRKNQSKLRVAIKNHQLLVLKAKAEPENVTVRYELKSAQDDIWTIGIRQKNLIELLRKELNIHNREVKLNARKEGLEERRCNLMNLINKSRKQTLTSRSASVSSLSNSDDSLLDLPSAPSSPNPPLLPHELSQSDFLGRMGLCTHDVFKELQNKRVERKRRSTANPQFLYGSRWDHTTKRKKNAYLMTMSPPNTRQAMKNRLKEQQQQQQQQQQHRISPPLSSSHSQSSQRSDSGSSSPVNTTTNNSLQSIKKQNNGVPPGLNIPNLPSGLTIERINGNKQSPSDNRICLVCRASGSLTVCETCNACFHVRCHNRPLVQQPRQCPKCLGRKDNSGSRDVGSLTVPPSMTVLTTYVPAEVKEKAQEKRVLVEKNRTLRTELNQLERRAEQLSISLRSQQENQQDMLEKQKITEQNIRRLLDFVNLMKGHPLPASPTPPPSAPSTQESISSPLSQQPVHISSPPSPTLQRVPSISPSVSISVSSVRSPSPINSHLDVEMADNCISAEKQSSTQILPITTTLATTSQPVIVSEGS